MRIGIDFDNTIICYDQVFCELAKSWQLVASDYQGTKRELRDTIFTLPDGETIWQRLQGKAYGEYIKQAQIFPGCKDFIAQAKAHSHVTLFIVSHKTELGHFDENKINLREAARAWLQSQGFFAAENPLIHEQNVFFESTRDAKIARIIALGCTHFIDDLVEVLDSPAFPKNVKSYLFQPALMDTLPQENTKHYRSWTEIQHALFPV